MASQTKRQKSSEAYRLMYGTCPDEACQAKLFFPSYDKSIECTQCGQRHDRAVLKNIAEVTNPDVALHNLLKNVLLGNVKPKKGADDVKVLGLSNYVCKLISPILTYYGMDRESGKAKLLSEMGKKEIFDVSILGDRAFLIEEENLNVTGYGLDKSGSVHYLEDTLKDIKSFNDNETRLVPIHADGDGHCLVHAISRALVGRELFWHALRANLKIHMMENLSKYKQLFQDFVDKDEWSAIVDECDPYYIPPEGEGLGLRNIHIFGLANVLHRPIILLDSKSGLSSCGDYSGVFLPGLIDPAECRGKDGSLNKPLCIAWSSSGRNHYIPLVAVKGKEAAKLPSYMVHKSWGMPKEEISKYIELDKMYRCSIGGDKCLTEKYLKQLVSTMGEVFYEKHAVNPSLVADVHQYIYKTSGYVGVHPDDVLERTKRTVESQMLFRCLMCEALREFLIDYSLYEKGGSQYEMAVKMRGELDPNKLYTFSSDGVMCSYDAANERLVPDMKKSKPKNCAFCSGEMLRQVRADGSIVYFNGDRTTSICTGGKCPCGFKHYWDGKEYDNIPKIFPITLQWGGKTITEKIAWFQEESDPTMNSNVFEVAQGLVQKHFPGEFGSERLVQQVVDSILAQSAALLKGSGESTEAAPPEVHPIDAWSPETASKIILTGQKKKTLHKEELIKSEKEKQVRKNIQSLATKSQHKKTAELEHLEHKKAAAALAAREKKPSAVTHTAAGDAGLAGDGTAGNQATAGHKKVRLQTSDGRQVMLTLEKDVTYAELQKLIFETVQVTTIRQKIRVGFPPKLLEAPRTEGEVDIVQLQHGDKIALEILPVVSVNTPEIMEQGPPQAIASTSRATASSWSTFEEDAQSQTAEKLLQVLKDTQHGGDALDTSIASLGILSAVSGKDLWTYVQGMPHLFSVDGLLYNQVKRDLGLVDGKHCQLPCLPGKVFRYSGLDDRLELCLEPYGHYQVQPNIENRVKEAGMQESKEEIKFGASGVVHHGQGRQAFGGQGHSLKSMKTADERMPVDLECAVHRPHVRGIHDLCSAPGSQHGGDTIAEEPSAEDMQVDETEDKAGRGYQRLGPGYSVIDQATDNADNVNLEMFRALAQQIEKTLAHTMEDDTQEDEDEDIEIPDKSSSHLSVSTTSKTSVITTPSETSINTTDNVEHSKSRESVATVPNTPNSMSKESHYSDSMGTVSSKSSSDDIGVTPTCTIGLQVSESVIENECVLQESRSTEQADFGDTKTDDTACYRAGGDVLGCHSKTEHSGVDGDKMGELTGEVQCTKAEVESMTQCTESDIDMSEGINSRSEVSVTNVDVIIGEQEEIGGDICEGEGDDTTSIHLRISEDRDNDSVTMIEDSCTNELRISEDIDGSELRISEDIDGSELRIVDKDMDYGLKLMQEVDSGVAVASGQILAGAWSKDAEMASGAESKIAGIEKTEMVDSGTNVNPSSDVTHVMNSMVDVLACTKTQNVTAVDEAHSRRETDKKVCMDVDAKDRETVCENQDAMDTSDDISNH